MLRTRLITAPAAAAVALALGLGGALVSATAASAHTPSVTADCRTLTVTAEYYDTKPEVTEQREITPAIPASPEVPAVIETVVVTPAAEEVPEIPEESYVEYEFVWFGAEGAGTTVWSTATPAERLNDVRSGNGSFGTLGEWRMTGAQRSQVTQPFVPGTPAVAEVTEERVITPAVPARPAVAATYGPVVTQQGDATPNTVVVTIDGEIVESTSFGTSFSGAYAFDDPSAPHAYTVVITAWNDRGGYQGWTRTITGTSTPCEQPAVAVDVRLTYMTGCATDETNTWRFRNPHAEAILITLSNGDTVLAAPGESFYETERRQETLTARWGGPGTGLVAGSTVKASGKDEISERCAGPMPETEVAPSGWTIDAIDCGTTTITESRTVETTSYALEGNEWVGTTTTTEETDTREMDADEVDLLCPIEIEPAAVEVVTGWVTSGVACETGAVIETRSTTTTPFQLEARQWVLGDPVVTTEDRTRSMTPSERAELCPAATIRPTAVAPLGDLPTLSLSDSATLARTGPSAALGGLGIAGLVALMTGLGLMLLRRPTQVSGEK